MLHDLIVGGVGGAIVLGLASLYIAWKLKQLGTATRALARQPGRDWVDSFQATVIQPGDQKQISIFPQLLFRVDQMINTGDEEGLRIRGLHVGSSPQMPPGIDIPVSMYRKPMFETDKTNDYRLKTCDPALAISIFVENRSKEPKTFSMTLKGRAVA